MPVTRSRRRLGPLGIYLVYTRQLGRVHLTFAEARRLRVQPQVAFKFRRVVSLAAARSSRARGSSLWRMRHREVAVVRRLDFFSLERTTRGSDVSRPYEYQESGESTRRTISLTGPARCGAVLPSDHPLAAAAQQRGRTAAAAAVASVTGLAPMSSVPISSAMGVAIHTAAG